MQAAPREGVSLREGLTTSSTRPRLTFSARSAGKSTLARQWLGLKAVGQHLGELSRLVAKGVLPHSSTTILQAVSILR